VRSNPTRRGRPAPFTRSRAATKGSRSERVRRRKRKEERFTTALHFVRSSWGGGGTVDPYRGGKLGGQADMFRATPRRRDNRTSMTIAEPIRQHALRSAPYWPSSRCRRGRPRAGRRGRGLLNEAADSAARSFRLRPADAGNWEVKSKRETSKRRAEQHQPGLKFGGDDGELETLRLWRAGRAPRTHTDLAVEWLIEQPDMRRGTYAISLRAQVVGPLLPPQDQPESAGEERDMRAALKDGLRPEADRQGVRGERVFGPGRGHARKRSYDHRGAVRRLCWGCGSTAQVGPGVEPGMATRGQGRGGAAPQGRGMSATCKPRRRAGGRRTAKKGRRPAWWGCCR